MMEDERIVIIHAENRRKRKPGTQYDKEKGK